MAKLGSSQYTLLMKFVNDYALRESPTQFVEGFAQIYQMAESNPAPEEGEEAREERRNAQCVIGTIYADGVGVKQDLAKGIAYYHRASGMNFDAEVPDDEMQQEQRTEGTSWRAMARDMIREARRAGAIDHLQVLLQVQRGAGHVIADCKLDFSVDAYKVSPIRICRRFGVALRARIRSTEVPTYGSAPQPQSCAKG